MARGEGAPRSFVQLCEASLTDVAERLNQALEGRYRVAHKLGAGGMAEVFLADDLRHDRKVAIKVLHEDLGATLGPERFLAEIKTTARLQHPHILPLLDSGSESGLLFYVMPYVEGESLRDRLNREKQLPIDDAVRIAREIADALGAASAQGIVHRDVKPENILLLGGHALVADFGIALAVQTAGGGRLTQTGLSLGTPQYMAPEQAMGEKSVDARADIYALGAVTYEMLVGEPPFTGATVQAIVAKVLGSEPEPPTTIRRTIPEHVEAAVLTALAKLPADRFATAPEFGAALAGGPVTTSARAVRPRRPSLVAHGRVWAIAGVTLGAFVGLAIGWLVWRGAGDGSSRSVARMYLRQPESEALPNGTSDFVLSPDGADLVYTGPGVGPGTTQLWRKRMADLHAARIPGTEGGRAPFFSPDGTQIAYYTSAGLMKLALAGGAPATVASGVLGSPGRGAWLPDGRIVHVDRTTLNIVPQGGGASTVVITNGQIAGYNPQIVEALPGGRIVVFQTCPSQCPRAVIYTADLDARTVKQIVPDGRSPTWLPSGHLAWINAEGKLLAAPFDADRLELTDAPVPVLESVAALSASRSGTLVYREGPVGEAARPVWVDRSGRATPVDSGWVAHMSTFGLSADGRRMAVSIITNGMQNLWIKELPRGPLTRLTTGDVNQFRPVWARDGRKLYFVQGNTEFGVAVKNADGSGDTVHVPSAGRQPVEATISPDGKWLAMRSGGTDTSRTIIGMRLGVDSAPAPLTRTADLRNGLSISPDGRYIAYLSMFSGQPEVYVSPFPEIESGRWQVSLATGLEARWSHDGRELYFITLKEELMAARVSTTPNFAVHGVTKLFDVAGYVRDGGFHLYEPEPGGTRFMMLKREVFPGHLVVVHNWFTELRDKLTPKR